jgi:TRAP-type mannitol/chloroaromatic compound transport system permease large subunit
MFFSVQLAFRRMPASLAVTTLLVSTFWGIGSGIVGAVVVLMGVIALRPMLKAGYDIRLASGVITAGGTLGILIPPSVMLIVYAAVAGQSIVKLYAAAMLPGFFLALLYLVYIVGWAMLQPKVAPALPPDQYRISVPSWLAELEHGPQRRVFLRLWAAALRIRHSSADYGLVAGNLAAAHIPIFMTAALFVTAWWYFVIHNAPAVDVPPAAIAIESRAAGETAASSDQVKELGTDEIEDEESSAIQLDAEPELESGLAVPTAADVASLPENFYEWFWGLAALSTVWLAVYYRRMDGEQLEILKMLSASVVPLAVLTFVVLAVILFGITTATESAAIGALGALYLASYQRYRRRTLWASLAGAAIGLAVGSIRADVWTLIVAGSLGATFAGTIVPGIWDLATGRQLWKNIKESTFLTARTTAMVCWLFVGSALFSSVFALHGGQSLIERFVLSLDLSPVQFMILAQAIIFLLGWPLEWTEIIVIFVPIFVPLLSHFGIDPVLFGIMVAVNLQAAFLSPPVAMSAFYLKGVAPNHVTLNQIFAGMMPYMLIVILCLIIMYLWPGMTLWLPNFLYGR